MTVFDFSCDGPPTDRQSRTIHICKAGEKVPSRRLTQHGGASLSLQISVAVLWTVLNVAFNFSNKWVLSPTGAGFQFPAFYTGCHMAMSSSIGARVIMAFIALLGAVPHLQVSAGAPLRILRHHACRSIHLSVNNVIKSMAPLPQSFLGYLIEGKVIDLRSAVAILGRLFGALSIPIGTPSYHLLLVLAISSLLAVCQGVNPTVLRSGRLNSVWCGT